MQVIEALLSSWPLTILVQTPRLPATLQALQLAVHVLSQQYPSTQAPFRQSPFTEQV